MDRYEQATHTCARDGLVSPSLGFQFRTVTAGLSPDALSAIARTMTGYIPPPSSAARPDAAELASFPVSLRYLEVEGVGPCVSRTVYVGREDRSDEGGGEGRFGNYFSHVAARPGPGGFASEHHPIELWESLDWLTDVSGPTAVEPLALAPSGSVTHAAAVTALSDPSRQAWLIALYDHLEATLEDRLRIIVVDDAEHAWAWVAALALALPRAIADRLTFDTYDGEPERSQARLCVSDPSVDRAVLQHRAHTGQALVVDPLGAGTAPSPTTLLGRAAAVYLRSGREAELARIARDMAPASALGDVATLLIVSAWEPDALRAADLDAVLATLSSWARGGQVERLEAVGSLIGGLLDAEVDMSGLAPTRVVETLNAVVAARSPADGAVAVLVRMLLTLADRVPSARVPRLDPAAFAPEVNGAAIALLSDESVGAAVVHERIALIQRLGMIGCNTALDRRIGRACARNLDDPRGGDMLRMLAATPGGATCVELALRVLSQRAAEGVLPGPDALAALSTPAILEPLSDARGAGERFPYTVLAAAVYAAANPQERAEHLSAALRHASSADDSKILVHALYRDEEIARPAIVTEVIGGHVRADARPFTRLIDAGWAAIERSDPFELVRDTALLDDLRRLDLARMPGGLDAALELARDRPTATADLRRWTGRVIASRHLLGAAHLPAFHQQIAQLIARVPLDQRHQHERAALDCIGVFGASFRAAYLQALQEAFERPYGFDLVASFFLIWSPETTCSEEVYNELVATWLAEQLEDWKPARRKEVSDRIRANAGPDWRQAWEAWCDLHPSRGMVGRTVGRLRQRPR